MGKESSRGSWFINSIPFFARGLKLSKSSYPNLHLSHWPQKTTLNHYFYLSLIPNRGAGASFSFKKDFIQMTMVYLSTYVTLITFYRIFELETTFLKLATCQQSWPQCHQKNRKATSLRKENLFPAAHTAVLRKPLLLWDFNLRGNNFSLASVWGKSKTDVIQSPIQGILVLAKRDTQVFCAF